MSANLRTHRIRCACIKADGEQCTRSAWATIPNITSADGHAYTYGRDVPLCVQHNRMFWRKRKNINWRMPLVHGGFVGPYNQYGYGSIVTTEPTIDWETVQRVTVPQYWAKDEATY